MKLRRINWTVVAVLALYAPTVHGQDQNQNPQNVSPTAPIAPISGTGVNGSGKGAIPAARGVSPKFTPSPNDFTKVEPDTHTLASIESSSVGSLQHTHDIFDPSFFISQGVQKDGTSSSSNSIFSARMNLLRTWSRYKLSAIYDGGKTFYVPKNGNSSYYQGVGVAQEINWNRWLVRIHYDFLASPDADFGGQGMGGPGLISSGPTGTGASTSANASSFIPSETILTGHAMRVRNVVLGEVNYAWSRRSRLTFSSSYGNIHFLDPGYINGDSLFTQAGYEYSIDPKNTIGVIAAYGRTEFKGTNTSTANYRAEIAYGRKITGKIAVQMAGGPEQIRLRTLGAGSRDILSWAFHGGLTYARRRSITSFSYAHGLTGGSGVLLGATSDTFMGSVSHQFSRFWTGSINTGYSLSSSLAPAGSASNNFSTWYSGAGIGRQVGRHLVVNFNYGVQDQKNGSVCLVASCGGTGLRQTAGITINWHVRQVE